MGRKRANGEGTTYQRADGRWEGAVTYVDPRTGVTRRHRVYGPSSTAVRAKLKAARARLDAGAPPVDATMTIRDYTARWIVTTLAASDRKATTKATYTTLARGHIMAGGLAALPLGRVHPSDVEAWLLSLRGAGKAPSTVRQTYTILRAVLDAAVRDGLLARNPAAVIRRPAVQRVEARYLSPADVGRLLAAAESSRYGPLLIVLAGTGLRRGEALALRRGDVDLEAGTARVRGTLARIDGALIVTEPKTERSRRTIPLPAHVVTALRAVRRRQLAEQLRAGTVWHETGFVFTTETGQPVDPRNAFRALTAAATAIGLHDVGLHTLRHSAASAMLEAGVPLKTVSELLGHSSVAITGDVYGHVSDDATRTAVERLSVALGW
ncbi:MAG: site-specific integrase [Pseudonocardiales bacterium]|nr:MAG: site-specific integrase [Pseudonocardiales bacterium]